MKVKSPIKLNLFLHIIGKRADGYHELETIFQLLDYYDEIEIITNTTGSIRRVYGNAHIPEGDDLLVRAARALQPFNTSGLGADIGIVKNAPIGGGVGGGSSNAATVLRTLNIVWNIHLPLAKLQEIALTLGADVPVFVLGQSAFATGVGEVLTPVCLPQYYFLVLCPDEHISTQRIFTHKALTKSPKLAKIPPFLDAIKLGNDCLAAALDESNKIAECIHLLNTAAGRLCDAQLSGTGASVWTVFATEEEAENALIVLRKNIDISTKSFVARGINAITTF